MERREGIRGVDAHLGAQHGQHRGTVGIEQSLRRPGVLAHHGKRRRKHPDARQERRVRAPGADPLHRGLKEAVGRGQGAEHGGEGWLGLGSVGSTKAELHAVSAGVHRDCLLLRPDQGSGRGIVVDAKDHVVVLGVGRPQGLAVPVHPCPRVGQDVRHRRPLGAGPFRGQHQHQAQRQRRRRQQDEAPQRALAHAPSFSNPLRLHRWFHRSLQNPRLHSSPFPVLTLRSSPHPSRDREHGHVRDEAQGERAGHQKLP